MTEPIAGLRWQGGLRLKQAREQRGWAEADLARAAGIDLRAIREYERGTRAPSVPSLLALATALGVSPDRLWPTAETHLGDFAGALAEARPREQWSVSKLTTYLMCPAKFYFAYVVGQPDETAMNVDAAIGHAAHAGVERILKAALGLPGVAPEEAIRQSLAQDLPHIPPDPETGTVPDAGDLVEEARRLVELYAAEIAPRFTPARVEQRMEAEIAGVPFTAVLDVITTDGRIRDTKTAKRRPSQGDIEENLQATVYTLAYKAFAGEDPQGVDFDYLIRNKKPVAETYSTARSLKDFDRLARIVEGVTEAAAAGRFYPNPQSKFGCSGCPFRAQCLETF